MPLSFLVHTPRLTIASIIRPCTPNASNACSHTTTTTTSITGARRFSIHMTLRSKAYLKRREGVDINLMVRLLSTKVWVGGLVVGVGVRGCNTGNGTLSIIPKRHHSGCPPNPLFAPEIEELFHGNQEYIHSMNKTNPGLLADLAMNGQQPPFMMVDCSDSRVSEQDIFSAKPGTLFTAGNIANRFDEEDPNSNAILSFAVETLKVKHVIVMGHYGCGGVAASMLPFNPTPPSLSTPRPADLAVQAWIMPIRQLYLTSTRPEIVAHRLKHHITPLAQLPALHDPAFRALVEENVKANVNKIALSSVMLDHYAAVANGTNGDANPHTPHENPVTENPVAENPVIEKPVAEKPTTKKPTTKKPMTKKPMTEKPTTEKPVTEVYIHGWVYDVENGKVSDLGVSVGPPGKKVLASPFPGVGR